MGADMVILELFIRFVLIGAVSIGGGLATIPYLLDLGNATGWFDSAYVFNMIALSEATPGPIGINLATLVGVSVGGWLGGLVASVGITLVGVTFMVLLAHKMRTYRDHRLVKRIIKGLRPIMIGLLFSVIVVLWQSLLKDVYHDVFVLGYSVVLIGLCSVLTLKYSWKPVHIILFCASCGLGVGWLR